MRLFNSNEQPMERTKALFTLGKTQLAQMNRHIYKLLPDTSDEIRLLAFNILDEEEGVITRKIEGIYAELKQPIYTVGAKAKLYKSLGLLYWELIYGDLVLQELEPTILAKALNYTKLAEHDLTADADLKALLGKIYQRLGQYKEAEVAFTQALDLNIPAAQVLPYLAEIKYKLKDYSAMMYYLNLSQTLNDVQGIAQIKKLWNMYAECA